MKLKHIHIPKPKVETYNITDFPIEDQERWAAIKPYKQYRTMEIETTAPRTKRSLKRNESATAYAK